MASPDIESPDIESPDMASSGLAGIASAGFAGSAAFSSLPPPHWLADRPTSAIEAAAAIKRNLRMYRSPCCTRLLVRAEVFCGAGAEKIADGGHKDHRHPRLSPAIADDEFLPTDAKTTGFRRQSITCGEEPWRTRQDSNL